MRTLAAHLVSRGFAYRYGGDEYVVILPTATRESAVQLMTGFQAKLEDLNYEITTEKPTVSIGLCMIDRDCHLTENEIEEKASAAKDLAKNEGKNCIATCNGNVFEIIRRSSSTRRNPGTDSGSRMRTGRSD